MVRHRWFGLDGIDLVGSSCSGSIILKSIDIGMARYLDGSAGSRLRDNARISLGRQLGFRVSQYDGVRVFCFGSVFTFP